MHPIYPLTLVTLAIVAQPRPIARAQIPDSAPTEPQSKWTIDDILLVESAGQFQMSPDGRWVVWVRGAMDKENGRRASNLWLTRIADGESWALTRGNGTHRSPRWAPDGRHIAFISSRDLPDPTDELPDSSDEAESQLWLLRLAGGEPWPLTTDARGLRGFAWKGPSSDTIVFIARETRSRLEQARNKNKDTGYAVEDTLEAPPIRLWTAAVQDRKVSRLTDNTDWIQSMAISPDGQWAVTRHEVSLSYEFDQRTLPATYLVKLDTGERRRILDGRRVIPFGMAWAPDGTGFYFGYEFTTHPQYFMATVSRMAFYDLATDSMIPVDLDWERGLGSPGFEVVQDGFVAHLADGVQFRPALYTRRGDGWRRDMLEGTHVGHIGSSDISINGELIAYVTSTANTPPQPYVARLDGRRIRDERQIATLNPSYAQKPKPLVEIIRWPGARNEDVEGVLYYPIDYEPGRPYPLIVSIHGGPASADRDAWSQSTSRPLLLFNQRGAFVLKPNYHGSSNYGLEWVESISDGRYYSLELVDIESGVDALITRGLVHADSVATHGWSNGAILSTALTVHNPERYKASSAGAGDVEWISDWGNVDFGAAFDNYYFGASPLEDPQRYIDLSPYFQLDKVRTPTLIFFGTEDRNVPPSQGWSHFRALQQLGNTEVRFVLFPGEAHGLRKLAHQRRKVREELAWFDKYLWGRPDTTNLALLEGSPLSALVARSAAARDGRLYGVRVNGVLVPHTVRRGALEIGQFEVTRAQWREFDGNYRIMPGTENYPVYGVTYERAAEYVSWLSSVTGTGYRLPTDDELRRLSEGASGGITLDYWAGYAPNPEDAARLQEIVARLPGEAPLLMEVGSVASDASGEGPAVYDLGGNVAEWATAPDGSGTLVGRSADQPRDPKARGTEAGPAYQGLRVVEER